MGDWCRRGYECVAAPWLRRPLYDLALVKQFCDRAAVMYMGNIVETLPAGALPEAARHPYTKSLIAAIFDVAMDFSRPIATIPGEVPSAVDRPRGCPFADRCPDCFDVCRRDKPVLTEIAPGPHLRLPPGGLPSNGPCLTGWRTSANGC